MGALLAFAGAELACWLNPRARRRTVWAWPAPLGWALADEGSTFAEGRLARAAPFDRRAGRS